MNSDLLLWYSARAAAMAAFFVLSASLLTGAALRTAHLASLARNRAVLALHGFLAWFWVPLVLVHVLALLLDGAARIRPLDLVVPFQVGYAALAIGLGTLGLLLLAAVWVTGALRSRMPAGLWRWAHRLAYPMFGLFLVHAQLAGTDFSRTWISVVGWATLGGLAVVSLVRLAGARVEPAAAPRTG